MRGFRPLRHKATVLGGGCPMGRAPRSQTSRSALLPCGTASAILGNVGSGRRRRLVLVVSHVLAALLGFGLIAMRAGSATAQRMFGNPSKRVGACVLGAVAKPTAQDMDQCSKLLAAGKASIGEPTASVLELRLFAARARAFGDSESLGHAQQSCLARHWPRCDPDSIRAMGAVK